MQLKAVSFDAAGTLLDPIAPIGDTYASLARRYSVEVSAATVERRFRDCFSTAPPLAFPGQHRDQIPGLERNWWKNLVKRIFEPYGPFPRFEEYFAALFAHFGKTGAWALYPETQETLTAIKDLPVVLIVISNFDSRLLPILDGLGIAPFFDSVVLSSCAGYAKPSPEIFHKALSQHHVSLHEAMHVGDSLETDALGALGAGLNAVWLNRNNGRGNQFAPQVRTLKEILPLIEG